MLDQRMYVDKISSWKIWTLERPYCRPGTRSFVRIVGSGQIMFVFRQLISECVD